MIRVVVIGFGGMGSKYAQVLAGGIEGMCLSGICCRNQAGQQTIKELYPEVVIYRDVEELFSRPEEFDAVVIVTPHNTHAAIGIQAFQNGKHVICDKPAGVSTKEVREFLAAKGKDTAFAMMFNTRTTPVYKRAKELLEEGVLGTVTRAVWVCNTWFRTPCYHRSAPWRSSWKGEQGGLLINQCQHSLDIWQWLLGMPDEVDASIDFGKYNDFAVDDSVDLRFFYKKESGNKFPGLRGCFLSSSGENPGVNRLEIWGSKGLMTISDGTTLTLDINKVDTTTFFRENMEIYGSLSHEKEEIILGKCDNPYEIMFRNFSDHIRLGTPLIAPGEEGLSGIMLANASYLSAWQNRKVTLPIEDEVYEGLLGERVREEDGSVS